MEYVSLAFLHAGGRLCEDSCLVRSGQDDFVGVVVDVHYKPGISFERSQFVSKEITHTIMQSLCDCIKDGRGFFEAFTVADERLVVEFPEFGIVVTVVVVSQGVMHVFQIGNSCLFVSGSGSHAFAKMTEMHDLSNPREERWVYPALENNPLFSLRMEIGKFGVKKWIVYKPLGNKEQELVFVTRMLGGRRLRPVLSPAPEYHRFSMRQFSSAHVFALCTNSVAGLVANAFDCFSHLSISLDDLCDFMRENVSGLAQDGCVIFFKVDDSF